MIRKMIMQLQAHKARSHAQRWVVKSGLGVLNEPLIRRFGSRVLSGPFKGMQLTAMTYKEHLGPFLLGTYENELHPVIELLLSKPRHPPMVIDIGAKFGYYAVGLALRLPEIPVLAFDTDWWARKATREMLRANNANNVSVHGECTTRDFQRMSSGTLVICDIEGAEVDLLPSNSGLLRGATLIVETHDCLRPGITDALTDHFRRTHQVLRIDSIPGSKTPPVDLHDVFATAEKVQLASLEPRPQQAWLYLTPER